MSFSQIIFFMFIGLTVIPAFMILFTKNVLHAAFALLITFLGVAGLYVFAQADFLSVTQIMIYVGGILVLILFGVMLTNRVAGSKYVESESGNRLGGTIAGVALFVLLFIGIVKSNLSALAWMKDGREETRTIVGKIGENLMTNFVLPFELAAVLLMVALMGAAFIASDIIKSK